MKRLWGITAAIMAGLSTPGLPVWAADSPPSAVEAKQSTPLLEFRRVDPNGGMAAPGLEEYLAGGNPIEKFPDTPAGKQFVRLNGITYLIDAKGVAVAKLLDVATEEISTSPFGAPPIPGQPATAVQLRVKLRAAEAQKLAEYAPPNANSQVVVFVLGKPLVAIQVTETITRDGELRLLEPRTDMKQLAEQLRSGQAAEKPKSHRK